MAANLDPRISRKRFLQGAAGVGIALGARRPARGVRRRRRRRQLRGGRHDDDAAADIKRGGVLRVGPRRRAARASRSTRAAAAPGSTRRASTRSTTRSTRVDPDLTQSPGLALEWNPNDDATVYEVKLRPDVVFHNGKSFTRRRRHLHAPADGRREAPRPLRGHEHQPRRPQEARRPDRADPAEEPDRRSGGLVRERHHGDGAGRRDRLHATRSGRGRSSSTPSRPASAATRSRTRTTGRRASRTSTRWEDISIDDADARLNALLSGEIDAMSQLGYPQAKAHTASGDIIVVNAPSPSMLCFYMAVDIAPLRQPEGARGVPPDPRPAGADRRRDLRLRHARQRPLRQGLQVLRRRHGGPRGRPREGEVAAQGGRPREPRR